MRSALKLGLTGGVAAALVAAPLPALAQDGTVETGDLTVTFFDDRNLDGVFDPTETARDGSADAKRTSGVFLRLADGTYRYADAYADPDRDFVFEDVPAGVVEVLFLAPNVPAREAMFDATGATGPADIERLPYGSYQGSPAAVAQVVVDAAAEELVVGLTSLKAAANVRTADGSPASATVEFVQNGDTYAAAEWGPGSYGTTRSDYTEVPFIPGEVGVRVTPPAGYQVAEVTADDYGSLPVVERDGVHYVDTTGASSYFSRITFTVTLAEAPDTQRPTATLASPAGPGPFQQLDIRVDATDDRGLARIVANIYQGGKLVKSTQSAQNGALSGSHTATVTLPDGAYTIRYNAADLAGNVSRTSEFAVTIDATAPTVTVKQGSSYTVGDGANYGLISFKLFDAGKVARLTLNGIEKDLTDNTWSDLNYVKPGAFGAVAGTNTLVVYDVAGNATTVSFVLDATAPTVTVKTGASETVTKGDGYNKVSFKLYDAGKVDRLTLNGVAKDLSNSVWSDLNSVKPGTFGAVKGENTLVVFDVSGNSRTVMFTLK